MWANLDETSSLKNSSPSPLKKLTPWVEANRICFWKALGEIRSDTISPTRSEAKCKDSLFGKVNAKSFLNLKVSSEGYEHPSLRALVHIQAHSPCHFKCWEVAQSLKVQGVPNLVNIWKSIRYPEQPEILMERISKLWGMQSSWNRHYATRMSGGVGGAG